MLTLSPAHWLLALVVALLLELCLGEPKRAHPLVGFGWLATQLERRCNRATGGIWRGALAWLLLIGLSMAAFTLLRHFLGWWADALALWFALGARSLFDHVRAIARPLSAGDLDAARMAVSRIVSRRCSQLDETGVAKAGLESTLENGADAIFSTLFFFALFGGYGALLHRLANTLDAMWGYKTPRLFHFGRLAARADDVLNFIPARLTAISYALLGHRESALNCWKTQAPLWDSPNAGPVMASGAGALQVSLGGEAVYHGQSCVRPTLGCGPAPVANDLQRGIKLVKHTLWLWLLSFFILGAWRWLQ